ncbi:extracellular solute-binding protein [Nocardioides sp.]|uniref:ABC transporter substrate-binding protein n=1 Tax=Nocardioides sp. TaxID=35761 RepID=UPI0019C7FA52|nr:extracellular solute-binding protein [Nocardioides sp.]MBC7279612.1 extracellular solute-binding protein [Nocardioides sp.]
MMRLKALATMALAGALALSACSGEGEADESLPKDVAEAGGMDELVKLAKAEGGELSLYAGTTEKSTTEWTKAFTEKYGIKVKLYRDGSTTLFQKWAQETQGGVNNADIVIQNVYQLWQDADEKGWITDYTTESAGDYDFETIYGGKTDLVDKVYSLHQSIGAIAWNTDVATPEQKALLEKDPVAALASPAFKGEIALGDTGGATTAGNYANEVYNEADKYGWDWLDGVGANNPSLFESQIPIAEQLVKGEYTVTFGTDTLYNSYIEQGAPIQYAYPDPTASALWMLALPTDTPHPYTARLFLEWATSPEGHDLMAELGTGTGTRTGWEDDRKVAEEEWYEAPNPWYGFADLEEMQGDGLGEFVTRVNKTLAN